MSERSTCWSVTINNPISADDDNIAQARQKSGWKVEGQLEEGENGTKHYQLMVKTPQLRFSAIKKMFPRAHIEVARNVKALSAYVHKDDTKLAELPQSEKYPTMSKFYELIYEEIIELYPRGEWSDWDEDEMLKRFDSAVRALIMKEYFVESFATNPQIRSSIKKFGYEILVRTQKYIRRQKTDRQTELFSEDESNGSQEDEESEISQTSSCSQSEISGDSTDTQSIYL